MKKINLIGQKFGRWLVLKEGTRPYKRVSWICRCDCGNIGNVFSANLKQGTSTSCGCYSEQRKTKHGQDTTQKMTSEYQAWKSMKARCYNKNRKQDYINYGHRGITVCDRWKNDFTKFFEDMGPKPHPKYSLDRIDVNGNYTPENCRWASPIQQRHNRRDSISPS